MSSINWIPVESEEQLMEEIKQNSLIGIFKHSTRCGISAFAKKQFEEDFVASGKKFPVLYIDLLKHRNISNRIEYELNVPHQSPQFILLKEGKVVYHASHHSISVDDFVPLS